MLVLQVIKNHQGQTSIEFTIIGSLITLVIIASSYLIKVKIDRSRCAEIVFKSTRAKLEGTWTPTSVSISFNENNSEVTGEAKCGQSLEIVKLPKLEPQYNIHTTKEASASLLDSPF